MYSGLNAWDFPTLILYMVVLAIGAFFCSYSVSYKRGVRYNYLSLVLMFIPWLLVLILRDESRGNDTNVYLTAFFNQSLSNAGEAFSYNLLIQGEPLYYLVTFILSLFVGGFSVEAQRMSLFFLQSFLWMFFVALALKEEAERIGRKGLVIAFITIFLIFFAQSFNIIRNTISMAIMLYAIVLLAKGKTKRYIVFNIIAVGFHYTAIIGFLMYFFVKESKYGFAYKMGIVLFLLFFFVLGNEWLNILFAGMDSRYEGLGQNAESFGLGNFAKRLPLLTLVVLFRKQLIAINNRNKTYILLIWLDFLTCSICYINPMFNRVTLYFDMMKIFIYPSLYIMLYQRTGKEFANTIALIVAIYLIWSNFDYYIYGNPYAIMPYFSPYFKL